EGYGVRLRQVPLPGLRIGPYGMMAQLARRPDHHLRLREVYGLWVSLPLHYYRSDIRQVCVCPCGLLGTGITVGRDSQGKVSTVQYPEALGGAFIQLGINKIALEKLLQLHQMHWVGRAVGDRW